MPISTGSIVLVSIRSLWAAQRVILTHTYRVTGDQGSGQPWERAQQLASFLAAQANGLFERYKNAMPNNATLQSVRAQVISPIRYQYGEAVVGVNGAWSQGAETGNVAVAVSLHTGLARRGEIAVKHIGPTPQNAQLVGAPTLAYRNTLNSLGNEFVIVFSQQVGDGLLEMRPVIWHRAINQSSECISWTIADRIGTMYRRTLRVGE